MPLELGEDGTPVVGAVADQFGYKKLSGVVLVCGPYSGERGMGRGAWGTLEYLFCANSLNLPASSEATRPLSVWPPYLTS